MATTLIQFADKIAKTCNGRLLHMSPAGALIQSSAQEMIAIPGPAETYKWKQEAHEVLSFRRLLAERCGFAYYQGAPQAVRSAYVPAR